MPMENQLAHAITQTEYDLSYDKAAKKLLANKQILAQIMKGCVNEYSDCTVDDIVDATPLHLHAISRRLRTTSNSTTLSSPRSTPSGRNTTPKCHCCPNGGTEAFACAHGRGGGRMIHTEASRKGIGAEGVDFGAAATPA